MKKIIVLGIIPCFILIFYLFCTQTVVPEYGDLVVAIQWSGTTEVTKTNTPNQQGETGTRQEKQTNQSASHGTETTSPDDVVRIRFSLEPGNLTFEFETIQSEYSIQTELGIYNMTIEAFNDAGRVIFQADTTEILIQPNTQTAITLNMTSNFPSTPPQFINLLPLNLDFDGTYLLSWTLVPKAETYTLQEDSDSSFNSPQIIYTDSDTSTTVSNQPVGTYYYRVRAENEVGESPWSTIVAFQVDSSGELLITTESLPDGKIEENYETSLCGTGGTLPYTFTLLSGNMPTGLGFVSSSNNHCINIEGLPTEAGTFNFMVEITDSGDPSQKALQEFTITINPADLWITTESIPAGIVGQSYSAAICAEGGSEDWSWEVSQGNLPSGIDLNQNETCALLEGIPTDSGTATFTITVQDNQYPALNDSKTFQLSIVSTLQIITQNLPDGGIAENYQTDICASGGILPYTWKITSGQLPSGLESTSNGCFQISGIPTESGLFTFSVKVTDQSIPQQSTIQEFSLTITPPILEITTPFLPSGLVGVLYSATLCAQGTSNDWSWVMISGALPPGLSFSGGDTCIDIQGVPTDSGSYTFSMKVTDNVYPNLSDSGTFMISIIKTIQPLVITTDTLPMGQVGESYDAELCAQGGTLPYTWNIITDSLPPGLNTTQNGCLNIAGQPTEPDTFTFRVEVKDNSSPQLSDTGQFTIIIDPLPLMITTESPLPDGEKGTYYNKAIYAEGGSGNREWSLISGKLPSGMIFQDSGENAFVRWTPTESGTFHFTVRVTDLKYSHLSDQKEFTLTIIDPALRFTISSLPDARLDGTYDEPVCAENGTKPYEFDVLSGSIPPGLYTNLLYSEDCMSIYGTPTTVGTYTFTLGVIDQSDPIQEANKQFSIRVKNYKINILTLSPLADGTQGVAYWESISADDGSFTWSWSKTGGTLPNGLTFSGGEVESAVISGTPTETGTFNITVRVTDLEYNEYDEEVFYITINSP